MYDKKCIKVVLIILCGLNRIMQDDCCLIKTIKTENTTHKHNMT